MNDAVLLDCIPFAIDVPHFVRKMRIEDRPEDMEHFKELARQAQAIARPRAVYKRAYVDAKTENTVVVDGVTLTSRVLRVNLAEAHRVFPFMATCGAELDTWSNTIDDLLGQYWADAIKEAALRAAMSAVSEHIKQHHLPSRSAVMSPGSLEDWPIQQQTELFAILGNTCEKVGVELTDSFLMVPIKSISGLRFPTEVNFESCQLCPRDLCPGRRAPYDPALYQSRFVSDKT